MKPWRCSSPTSCKPKVPNFPRCSAPCGEGYSLYSDILHGHIIHFYMDTLYRYRGIVYKDELYIDILHIDTLYMDKWTCYTWNIKRITEFLPVGMFKATKGCRAYRVWDASPKVLRVYWDLPHGVGLAGGVIVLKVVGIDCIAIKGYSGHSRCLINECLFKKKNPQFL